VSAPRRRASAHAQARDSLPPPPPLTAPAPLPANAHPRPPSRSHDGAGKFAPMGKDALKQAVYDHLKRQAGRG
jgi:hypothetical protein